MFGIHSSRKKKNIMFSIVFLTAFTAVYLLTGLHFVGQHMYLGETDTTYFIQHILQILKQENFLGFLASFFKGTYTENNQTPLFPSILCLFYSPTISFFIHIKLFNLMLGLVYLYLLYFILHREAGEFIAACTVCIFAANDNFMNQTTMVSCEPLLMITSTLALYFFIRGLHDNRSWIAAGIFTGLSYLTKPSGLFILFGFGIFLLYDCRLHIMKLIKNRYLWMCAGSFIIVCFPLLFRNVLLYKFPFYTLNMDMLAWYGMDSIPGTSPHFTDIFHKQFTENTLRFFTGIVTESRILIHSLYSFSIHFVPKFSTDTTALPGKIAAAALAVSTLAVSIFGFVTSGKDARMKVLIGCMILGFFLPLSWYSMSSPNRRYLLPVIPFFLIFTISGAEKILSRIRDHKGKADFRFPLLAGLTVIAAIYPLVCHIPDPMKSYRPIHEYEELALYIRSHMGENEKYLTAGIHYYSWDLLHPELENLKEEKGSFIDFNDVSSFLESNQKIRFMLIQPEFIATSETAFKSYIGMKKLEGLTVIKNIPGWRIVRADSSRPSQFILYEREESHNRNYSATNLLTQKTGEPGNGM